MTWLCANVADTVGGWSSLALVLLGVFAFAGTISAEGFIKQWRAQIKAEDPDDNRNLEVADRMLIEWETLARYLKRNQDGE